MDATTAENILLKDALRQAQRTVWFLHNCLINPSKKSLDGGFKYAHPEHTLRNLAEWATLAPLSLQSCCHGMLDETCPACVVARAERAEVEAARAFLRSTRLTQETTDVGTH